MAITIEAFSGIETVGATEWSMTTDTAGPDVDTSTGCFQAFIDMNALAAADVFEWRLYDKGRTGGTQRLAASARIAGVQATPIWISPAFLLGIGWDMTLKKISGTDRSIEWRISKSA